MRAPGRTRATSSLRASNKGASTAPLILSGHARFARCFDYFDKYLAEFCLSTLQPGKSNTIACGANR
jgi:hypothetical protein